MEKNERGSWQGVTAGIMRALCLKIFLALSLGCCLLLLAGGCVAVRTTYKVAKTTVNTTYKTASLATRLTIGTVKTTYKIGKFTYRVISAPFSWPMTHDYDEIDGLAPKEAVRLGKVKDAPYTVHGHRYYPMSVAEARHYRQVGIASWYGFETYHQQGGHMTADGEAFNPAYPTAAHKYLPLPSNVRVTNLENGRSIIVRVNDRGPFFPKRIIDLSAGAAKRLGFYRKGTAKVLVETVNL